MVDKTELIVIPNIVAHRAKSGNLVLTKKFLDGMVAYTERWPKKITAMVKVHSTPDSNLDHVEVVPSQYQFGIKAIPENQKELEHYMLKAGLVLGGPIGIRGVRQVIVKETSLQTRLQIIAAETPHPIKRWKRLFFAIIANKRERRIAGNFAGIQCNGTPTYNSYKHLNKNTMMFFDSRIEQHDVITEEALSCRTERLLSGEPLRLAFTGRLMRIKGSDGLIEIAEELRRLGVQFKMDICGGGECEEQLERDIYEKQLNDQVHLRGILPYREKLLPFIRNEIDLFVCPHIQGDPSCTYIETMACGVPIIGYANEAWEGMAPISKAGWITPMKRTDLLAERIAELSRNRGAIAEAAKAARTFAAKHIFEHTMDQRIDHMLSCLDSSTLRVNKYARC